MWNSMFEPGLSLLLPYWLSSYIMLHNKIPQINVSGDQGFASFIAEQAKSHPAVHDK